MTTVNVEEIKTMSVKERIIRVSNEIKIEKTGWNSYGEYAYVTPEDLENALKPLLLKYRLFTHVNVSHLENGRNIATLKIEDFDNDDDCQVYTMDVPDITLKAANAVQSVGGLRTFCTRYLKMSAFSVAENSDDFDNLENGGEGKPAGKKKSENPDEKVKNELIKFCQERIGEDEGNRKKINEMLKNYGADGKIKDMTTANAKKALADMKKIFGGNN